MVGYAVPLESGTVRSPLVLLGNTIDEHLTETISGIDVRETALHDIAF